MTRGKATTQQAREARALRETGTQELLELQTVPDTWVVERRVVAGVLCQLQYVKCGKRRKRHADGSVSWGCWCMEYGVDPPFHGPYWYAYTLSKRRKLRSHYVGKVISAKRVRAAVA